MSTRRMEIARNPSSEGIRRSTAALIPARLCNTVATSRGGGADRRVPCDRSGPVALWRIVPQSQSLDTGIPSRVTFGELHFDVVSGLEKAQRGQHVSGCLRVRYLA